MSPELIGQIILAILALLTEGQKAFNALPEDLKAQHYERMRFWEAQFDKFEALLKLPKAP